MQKDGQSMQDSVRKKGYTVKVKLILILSLRKDLIFSKWQSTNSDMHSAWNIPFIPTPSCTRLTRTDVTLNCTEMILHWYRYFEWFENLICIHHFTLIFYLHNGFYLKRAFTVEYESQGLICHLWSHFSSTSESEALNYCSVLFYFFFFVNSS